MKTGFSGVYLRFLFESWLPICALLRRDDTKPLGTGERI